MHSLTAWVLPMPQKVNTLYQAYGSLDNTPIAIFFQLSENPADKHKKRARRQSRALMEIHRVLDLNHLHCCPLYGGVALNGRCRKPSWFSKSEIETVPQFQ